MALGNWLEPEEGDKPPPLPLPALPFPSLPLHHAWFHFQNLCTSNLDWLVTYLLKRFTPTLTQKDKELLKKICWARFFHYHSVCIFRKVWNAV